MPATSTRTATTDMVPYVQWGPVLAGALTAASLAFLLHSFAAAIGLSVASTAPTWRDASMALWLLTGVYLILVALASYGLGGYIAGRLRSGLVDATAEAVEFRDGMHGVLVWAVATVLTVLLALSAASSLTRLAGPENAAGAATSVGSENIIAYDIDRLFRTGQAVQNPEALEYHRAEAGRILLTASSHSGVTTEDRTYLIQLVAARTGAAPNQAGQRVDAVIASARDNIARARRNGVIIAFMTGAAALLGAAAAWFAAIAGGDHRDHSAPSFYWGARRPAAKGKI